MIFNSFFLVFRKIMYRLIPVMLLYYNFTFSLFDYLIIIASSFYHSTYYRLVKTVIMNKNFPRILERIRQYGHYSYRTEYSNEGCSCRKTYLYLKNTRESNTYGHRCSLGKYTLLSINY